MRIFVHEGVNELWPMLHKVDDSDQSDLKYPFRCLPSSIPIMCSEYMVYFYKLLIWWAPPCMTNAQKIPWVGELTSIPLPEDPSVASFTVMAFVNIKILGGQFVKSFPVGTCKSIGIHPIKSGWDLWNTVQIIVMWASDPCGPKGLDS